MSNKNLYTAAFGMGCFWGPDALFGARKGIIRTRVGYAGGTTDDPTYRNIGDHTETVLFEFDPDEISYADLLEIFWDHHHYRYSKKRGKNQYASRLFYSSDAQQKLARKSKAEKEKEGKVATEIQSLNFTIAENYHQKYRLRHSKMMENFSELTPEAFRDSTLAAKLNAYAAGHLDLEEIKKFDFEVEPSLKDRLMNSVRQFM